MKMTITFLIMIFIVMLIPSQVQAFGVSGDRFHVSLIISHSIWLGIGYEHRFDDHHALHVTFHPLSLIHIRANPTMITAGYCYHTHGHRWRFKGGAGIAIMGKLLNPFQTITKPIILLTPGVEYVINDESVFDSQLWLAYIGMLNKRFQLPMPLGLEFHYSRQINK
jgi:hypothetical protein